MIQRIPSIPASEIALRREDARKFFACNPEAPNAYFTTSVGVIAVFERDTVDTLWPEEIQDARDPKVGTPIMP